MTTETAETRIDRLKMTRRRLEEQLADPKTPPYSIAPLSNQLRLTDKEIERLEKATEEDDQGLPITTDRVTFLHLLQYAYLDRRPRLPRRAGPNSWSDRRDDIFDQWREAGFELPPMPWRHDGPEPDRRPADVQQAERTAWVEQCRAELARCLEEAGKTPGRVDDTPASTESIVEHPSDPTPHPNPERTTR